MLKRSFVHLEGIGPVRERKLWGQGVRHWDQLEAQVETVFRADKWEATRAELMHSRAALERNDLHYFYKRLPREQLWRILPGNFEEVSYLDIETTGLGMPPTSHSTTITFVHRGEVLQEHVPRLKGLLVRKVASECRILCTFFGEVFDVPFLRSEFDVPFEVAHIDLCFWLKRLGFKGGLKRIQKEFSDIPARQSLDIDGFDAVRLWDLHLGGMSGALETLLAYNAEDTVVLEPLLIKAYNLQISRHPELGLEPRADRAPLEVRARVHPAVYESLRGGGSGFRHRDVDFHAR